jgi:hypothetical protein
MRNQRVQATVALLASASFVCGINHVAFRNFDRLVAAVLPCGSRQTRGAANTSTCCRCIGVGRRAADCRVTAIAAKPVLLRHQ